MMRLFRFILLLPLLLFSCYSSILGQSTWFFKQLAVRDGLSNNQINHIFRDSNGFMWFSTASELNRYDGYKFKVFFHNPNDEYSLPDNLISSVQEDANRRLWIQTGNGYTVFNPEKEKFEQSTVLLQEMGVSSPADFIFIDKDKNIWCYVAASGLYMYHASNGQSLFFPQNKQPGNLSSGVISDITESESSYLLIFQSGLIQYRIKIVCGSTIPITLSYISSRAMSRTSRLLSIRKTTFGFILICPWEPGSTIPDKKNGNVWDQKKAISLFYCPVT